MFGEAARVSSDCAGRGKGEREDVGIEVGDGWEPPASPLPKYADDPLLVGFAPVS